MRHKRRGCAGDVTPLVPDSSGSLAAVDQMSNWVRFADTKATILAAGLGAVITILTSSATTVVKALDAACPVRLVVGGLAAATVLAFFWTLFWVVRAIAPRKALPYETLNRFAWPSLIGATAEQLVAHANQRGIEADAWQQVVDLAAIANSKFDACRWALYGFGVMIAAAVLTILIASAFAGL